MISVNIGETLVPFDVQTGTTGQTVVVQLRKQGSTTLFLDFADGVFKSAGWTTKQLSLSEVGVTAVYTGSFNSTVGTEFQSQIYCIAEFLISGVVVGIEYYSFDDKPSTDAMLTLIKKIVQNRLVHSGTTVTIYDDDSTTPLLTLNVKDKNGTLIDSSDYAVKVPTERTRAV